MDPLTLSALIAGGSALGSLASGFMQSNAAAKASAQQRELIKDILNKVEAGWQLPDASPISFEEFRVLETFVPEVAQFVQEQAPQLVTEKGAQEEIRAQREALRRLQQTATGEDRIALAQQEQALSEADARAQSMRQQALSTLAQTGQLQGGQRILAEQAAISDAAKGAREASLQAAIAQEQRQRAALGQAADLATKMRSQEGQKERSNIDIINDFNRRAAQRRQAHLTGIADQRNRARQANINQRQRAADANVELRNAMAKLDAARRDARVAAENEKLRTVAGVMGKTPTDAAPSPWAGPLATAGQAALGYGIQGLANQMGNAPATADTTQTYYPYDPDLDDEIVQAPRGARPMYTAGR